MALSELRALARLVGNLGQVRSGLNAVQGDLGKVRSALDSVGKGAEAVGQKAALAFAAAGAALAGWVRIGLQGTSVGAALTVQVSALSREIAQLFIPQLQKVSELLQKAIDWFRSLSGAQQESIGKWLLLGTAALGVMAIVPKIIAGVASIIGVVNALTASLAGLDVASGGILPLAGALVTAAAGLAVLVAGTEEGSRAFQRIYEAGQRIVTAIGPSLLRVFEQLADVLARVLVPVLETLAGVLELVADGMEAMSRSEFGRRLTDALAGGLLLGPIGAVAGLLGGFGGNTNRPEPGGTRRELAPGQTGFEGIAESFKRVQLAAIQQDIRDRKLEVAQEQLQEQRRTNFLLERRKPGVI